MNLTTNEQIRIRLTELHNLEECILTDISWENHGTTIEIVVNNVWDSAQRLRESILALPQYIRLRFELVQEFHLRNSLTPSMLSHISNLDWGIDEIAFVRIVENSELLARYETSLIPMHHLVFEWEGSEGRQLDIIFGIVDIPIDITK